MADDLALPAAVFTLEALFGLVVPGVPLDAGEAEVVLVAVVAAGHAEVVELGEVGVGLDVLHLELYFADVAGGQGVPEGAVEAVGAVGRGGAEHAVGDETEKAGVVLIEVVSRDAEGAVGGVQSAFVAGRSTAQALP